MKEFFKKYYGAFSKNEKGEDIFYPWRYPGEALVLTAEMRERFKEQYKTLFLSCFSAITFACAANSMGLIDDHGLRYAYGAIVGVFFILYLAFVSFYKRRLQLNVVQKNLRPRKYLILSWFFLYLQVAPIFLIYYSGNIADPINLLFSIMLGLSALIMIVIFLVVIRSRGYVLESCKTLGS